MENLLTRNISFNNLYESFNGNESEIQNFINNIQSPTIKERIIDEAKDFYAKFFNVNKEDVWYGNISCRFPECKNPFPFSHVIGTIDLGQMVINMDKLVYCNGINSTGVQFFPNLEIINGIGNFSGTPHRTSYINSLPKLKIAPYLYCANSSLKELALEDAIKVNLTKSSIKKIKLKNVSEDLSVSFTPISDISSLERVGNFNCRETNIEIINPNLEIFGKLHAENSNNFEEKITTEKHDCWHTDNGDI